MEAVTISLKEYAELVRKAAQIDVLERMLACGDFIHESNLRIIFNINKKEIGNETV